MRFGCLAAVLVCLFADVPSLAKTHLPVVSAAESRDDLAVRQALITRVDTLLKSEDFGALNKLDEEYRTTRARTPSGVWKLRVFHMGIRRHFALSQPEGECVSSAGPMLQRWLAADPAAPAPVITRASILLEQAWCKRHDRAWGGAAFHRDAAEAEHWLLSHKATASIDPEYYATAEDVGFVTRSNKADFERLLYEGIAREPGYYGIYFSALRYYLPNAYGSIEDVDRIARLAADKTSDTDGTGAYARVYWVYVDCGCSIWQSAVDWQLMKRSMADVVARYPADWNIANFAKIACEMGDGGEAAKYLAKAGDQFEEALEDEDQRDQCIALARRPGVNTASR